MKWLFITLVLAQEAIATMIPKTTEQLTANSVYIGQGKIQAVRCEWTEDKAEIVTVVTVRVAECLKGTGEEVTFRFPGGTVGNLTQKVSDMPTVQAGQEILVFLRKPEGPELQNYPNPTHYHLLSCAQGLYHVSGETASRSGYSTMRETNKQDRINLSTLKQAIRSCLSKRY